MCDMLKKWRLKRGIKHWIYIIPQYMGLKYTRELHCSSSLLDVYGEEQSSWEQSTVRLLLPALPHFFFVQLKENVALLPAEPTVWKSCSVVVYACEEIKRPLNNWSK